MRIITGPEKIQILNQGNKIGNVSNGKLLRIYFNNFSVLSWDLVLIIYVINYEDAFIYFSKIGTVTLVCDLEQTSALLQSLRLWLREFRETVVPTT